MHPLLISYMVSYSHVPYMLYMITASKISVKYQSITAFSTAREQVPTFPPLTQQCDCSKPLSLSQPPSTFLKRSNITSYLTGLSCELKVLIHAKCLGCLLGNNDFQ